MTSVDVLFELYLTRAMHILASNGQSVSIAGSSSPVLPVSQGSGGSRRSRNVAERAIRDECPTFGPSRGRRSPTQLVMPKPPLSTLSSAPRDQIVLEVADDLRGIGGTPRTSSLANMERRAQRLGGTFTITSDNDSALPPQR